MKEIQAKNTIHPILYLFLIISVFLIFGTPRTWAAEYYVDGSMASDDGNGDSWENAKKYIKSGISRMQGGDTLTIRNGVYTGKNNCLDFYGRIPSGNNGGTPNDPSDDVYTTIRAETDFGVLIDGEGNNRVWVAGNSGRQTSYVQFIGMKFANSSGTNVLFYHMDHIKMLRCASYETGVNQGRSENQMNFAADRPSCSYILLEDCFAWGAGRYKFAISAPNSILRRCVARCDYHSTPTGSAGWPQAGITFYTSENTTAQNCIVLDGRFTCTGHYQYAFGAANGYRNVTYNGCIALNNEFHGSVFEKSGHFTPDSGYLKNCVIWGNAGMGVFTESDGTDLVTVTHSLIGDTRTKDGSQGWGLAYRNINVSHSIIYSAAIAGIHQVGESDYNLYFNNTSNFSEGSSPGTNDYCLEKENAFDPKTHGLMHLPVIQDDSKLKTAGLDGQQIGAQIYYRIGKSGTLWGEPGWDQLQDGTAGQAREKLWPWPNESKIRDLMRAYNLHGVNGARGFCADGKTLTSYIWEHLGNDIPADIYKKPGRPQNLIVDRVHAN